MARRKREPDHVHPRIDHVEEEHANQRAEQVRLSLAENGRAQKDCGERLKQIPFPPTGWAIEEMEVRMTPAIPDMNAESTKATMTQR